MAGVHFETLQLHKGGGGSTKNLTKIYFEQLDRQTVDELYQLYQVDFEMFGYSPELYFTYANTYNNKESDYINDKVK